MIYYILAGISLAIMSSCFIFWYIFNDFNKIWKNKKQTFHHDGEFIIGTSLCFSVLVAEFIAVILAVIYHIT